MAAGVAAPEAIVVNGDFENAGHLELVANHLASASRLPTGHLYSIAVGIDSGSLALVHDGIERRFGWGGGRGG